MYYRSFRFPPKDVLVYVLIQLSLIAILTGCATNKAYELNLMPAPDVFENGAWQPFSDTNSIKNDGTIEILYATDREPVDEQSKEKFYQNKRGYLLRLGKGQVKLGKGDYTWEEMKHISLLKNRTEDLPLQVTSVKEYGILNTTISEFDSPKLRAQNSTKPADDYASIVNAKLANSKNKDIYVYLHGYKVNFENPLIVASELWHYLGYEGVFIAYAWPSTPSVWAYASDAETATDSARNLRLFLKYLSDKTSAREIHIVGYSMGTRLVAKALYSFALIHNGQDKQTIQEQLRIGHVILVGSDVDMGFFASMLLDGALNVSRSLNIYMSTGDKALGMSKLLLSRKRLGQIEKDANMKKHHAELLFNIKDLNFIDVSDAEGSMTGNGHAYFRKSPWASSDILVTLAFDLKPQERGLTRTKEKPIWVFPSDYNERLKSILAENNPVLSPLKK